MENQPSTSNDDQEPPRIGIPDDFIWRPEYQAWFAPGEPSDWDHAAFRRELEEMMRESREKCIAEGTWNNGTVIRMQPLGEASRRTRKTLGGKSEQPLPLFPDDDDEDASEELSAWSDLDDDEDSSDELE